MESYRAGQGCPERWPGGARSEHPARGTGAVYDASQGSCESITGGGDGAFVAEAPLCVHPRTIHAVSIAAEAAIAAEPDPDAVAARMEADA